MNLQADIKKVDNAIDEFVLSTDCLIQRIKAKKMSIQNIAVLAGFRGSTLYDKIKNYTLTPHQWRNVLRAVDELDKSQN